MTKRPLCGVIIPRNAVSLQKNEERFAITLEPLLIFNNEFLAIGAVDNSTPVENIHSLSVFAQVAGFQPESLNIRQDRQQQVANRSNEVLQLDIKRILPKVVVQVMSTATERDALALGFPSRCLTESGEVPSKFLKLIC